jgi:Fe-S-cluster containining protein
MLGGEVFGDGSRFWPIIPVPLLTCEKGCGRCCEVGGTSLQLLATEAEAVLIGQHIGRDPEMNSGKPIDQIQFGPINERPCPFYVESACSIYEVRPEGCRQYQCDLTDPHRITAESLEQLVSMITEQTEKGSLYADLRTWFPDVGKTRALSLQADQQEATK